VLLITNIFKVFALFGFSNVKNTGKNPRKLLNLLLLLLSDDKAPIDSLKFDW